MSEDSDRRARADTEYMWIGHAAGLEEASRDAKLKAGEAFADHRDEVAGLWRVVAAWLSERAEKARKRQNEVHRGVTPT